MAEKITKIKNWIGDGGEYYYSPHHKYEGVFELYWVDKDKVSHCVQNFCLEESAMVLAKEDKFWRLNEYPISNCLQVTRSLKNKKPLKEQIPQDKKTFDPDEEKRLAKKKKRQERKAKLKLEGG